VQPVDTDLGRKTRIDQTTCNTITRVWTVTVRLRDGGAAHSRDATARRQRRHPVVAEPAERPISGLHSIFLAGIGGTGIVTVNQVLAMAALRTGLHVEGLDQTLKPKGRAGHVASAAGPARHGHVKPDQPSSADCVIAFDLLLRQTTNMSGTQRRAHHHRRLDEQDPDRHMVYDGAVDYPGDDVLLFALTFDHDH